MEASRDYRRWAFESAALDLALRQAGLSLADVAGASRARSPSSSSMRLGDPPTHRAASAWLEHYPELRFKLDPTSSWTDAFVAELAELGAVDVARPQGPVRGHGRRPAPRSGALPAPRRGLPGGLDRGPGRHRRDATRSWSRTATASRGTRSSTRSRTSRRCRGRRGRSTSSRRGSGACDVSSTRTTTARSTASRPYGGGQFELGPGRGHIQYLASLFHPDAPNDVAPGGFNASEPQPGLPTSPLEARPSRRASAGRPRPGRAAGAPRSRRRRRRRAVAPWAVVEGAVEQLARELADPVGVVGADRDRGRAAADGEVGVAHLGRHRARRLAGALRDARRDASPSVEARLRAGRGRRCPARRSPRC